MFVLCRGHMVLKNKQKKTRRITGWNLIQGKLCNLFIFMSLSSLDPLIAFFFFNVPID